MGIFIKRTEHDRSVAAMNAENDRHIKHIERLERDIVHLQAELEALRKANKALRTALKEQDARFSQERLQEHADHRAHIARLEVELRAERARADTATANFEWQRLMFNKSEAERATLMQHVLKAPVPAFELAREPGPQPTRPATSPAESAVAAPPAPGGAVETAISGLAMSMGLDFEDVGDEMARALGVSNDNPEGRLEHR